MSINKKYVMAGVLATALVAPLTDATNSYADDTRTITGRVNFRTGPGKSYSSMGKIEKGKKVTYLGSSGNWIKIKYNSKTGYIYKDYISKATTSTSSSTSTSVRYVKSSDGLNVRKGPSVSYSKITNLPNGTKVTVKSTSNGWSKITSGSITGYVNSSYLTSKKPSTTTSSNSSSSSTNSSTSTSNSASKVISYAKKLLGKPYVWGAQGPNGFDCSGFTYYVYKNSVGVTLNRTSADQSKNGSYVSKSSLRAGDLVFFDTSGPNNGAISHVGIYIGNGQMIHSSSSKGQIVIVNMNTSYWNNAYVTARRIV